VTSTIRFADAPIVLLLHGLNGHSEAHYIRRLVESFARLRPHQFRVMVLHARGAALDKDNGGYVALTKPRFYHAAYIDDLRDVAQHLASMHPRAPKFLVGFSMGSNIVATYLGTVKNHGVSVVIRCGIDAIVIASLLVACRCATRTIWSTCESG
jgi:predicted alpha/beta-fold hydrolase